MREHAAFIVPVVDRWLLYAPLHQVAALVNRSAATAFRDGVTARSPVSDLGDHLRQSPPSVPRPLVGDVSPSFLGIVPTRRCNLACAYCNFGGPTADRVDMRPEVAVAAIDWMAERLVRTGRRHLEVHLFGGEPFVSPEIVDVVVHRVRALAARHGLIPYLAASTNGVFSRDRCRFIGEHFGGVVLSLDGPPDVQNRQRPGLRGRPSFDVVSRTAKQLAELPLDLCLRVCVTDDSVGELENITRWMIESYRPTAVSLESLTPGDSAERAGLRIPDPYRFAVHCVRALRIAEELGSVAVHAPAETARPRLSFCPVGTDAVIVSPEGRAGACYLLPGDWQARGLDMDIGWVHADGRVSIDEVALARTRRLPWQKHRCGRCFCQWTCAGGCHVSQTFPGCPEEYTPFCIQTRLVTACRLLHDLGCEDLIDELLSDRGALERLAGNARDSLDLAPTAAGNERRLAADPEPLTWDGSRRPRPPVSDGLAFLR